MTKKKVAKKNGSSPITLKSKLLEKYEANTVELDVDTIPTGIDILDRLLGGGFAQHKLNLICGAEGSGKSTMIYQSMKKAMSLGYFCVLIEQEGGVSKGRLDNFGIKETEGLLLLQPPDLETAEEIVQTVADNALSSKIIKETDVKDYKGIVVFWDSITAATPAAEFEQSSASDGLALKARILGKMLSKFPTLCKQSRITMVIVSQLRSKLDVNPFARKSSPLQLNEDVIPGGRALRFQPFVILQMNPKSAFKVSKAHKAQFGRVVECKTLKNKFTNPMIPFDMVFSYKKGFSNILTMFHLLQEQKKIKVGNDNKLTLKGFKDPDDKSGDKDLSFSMAKFVELLKTNTEFQNFCINTYNTEIEKIIAPGDTRKIEELL